MAYIDYGDVKTPVLTNTRFIENTKLVPAPLSPWTNVIGLDYPNTGPNGSKSNVATVIKVLYSRIINATTTWPDTVLKTTQSSDNAFGPLDTQQLWSSDASIKWMTAQDKKIHFAQQYFRLYFRTGHCL